MTITLVDQEYLHDPDTGTVGDCWRACLATILEVPNTEVPHFVRDHGDEWFTETQAWLTEHHGATIVYYDQPQAVLAECRAETSAYPFIMIDGYSPRGVLHVVVATAERGTIIHDPHPSRAGLDTVQGVFVLIKAEDHG